MPKSSYSFLRLLLILIITGSLSFPSTVNAQIVSENEPLIDTDSLRRAMDNGPYFGLYKDNYFIFGTSIGQKPTKENSNVKFQISISQRLTNSVLPWNTYFFLFYTQKVFWNVLENSMPMTDLNFNPGLGLAKPLFVKNRFIGKLILLLEHESNGRDGISSRSWNKLSLGGNIILDPRLTVHAKFWIPIIDGMNNRDILDYSGIYQMGLSISPTQRLNLAMTFVKRKGWALNYNSIIELSYRIFKRDNQYLFMQYYNGYGESLLFYKQFHSQLRVGIVIKPQIFSDF